MFAFSCDVTAYMCVWTRSGKEVMGWVHLYHALSLSLPLWNAKIILKLLIRDSNIGIIKVKFLDKVNFLITGLIDNILYLISS